MKRLLFSIPVVCFFAAILAVVTPSSQANISVKSATFSKDVAPIFFKKCAECHRPGESAPMSLLNYKDARPWAKAIREKVANREMPPWHADPRVGEFANDRRLTQTEIDTITDWVDGGAQEGNPKELPSAPQFADGWGIGKPRNKFNPDPGKEARYGEPTYDEMMMGFPDYSIQSEKIGPEKNAQANNIEAAKRFAGTWKGKPRPDAITDAVIIFKMEGAGLKGTIRQTSIRREEGGEPQIVRDEYVPLPDLSVEGTTLTWKDKWIQPGHEVLRRVTLIGDDEILFETVGTGRSSDQPTLLSPVSYKLKREK